MTLQVNRINGRWEAREAGALAGRADCWVRPDGKRFAHFGSDDAAVIAALGAAITAEHGRPLHTTADADDRASLLRFGEAGFVGERYEHRWTLPVDVAADWDDEALAPFEVGSPETFGPEQVQRLDERLRADVPGLRGWRWTAEAWAAEHGTPAYDPALYPVVWDPMERRFAAMARVWSDPDGPRLGLVAVARPYRRRGLAAALMARVFRELRERERTEVAAECDAANAASCALMAKAGGTVVGGEIELILWN
ncbi:GNAT family N-acetyltransferase [Glycomyces sp. TRM65418]|uniref:GNAT family N-acetyltransferase n=1 Tax=Glycomyces sp. TRM65418 TaxID=2867006 RepID=UPI001CE66C76|nr:GNAT family N-acetyltransferase [Glycomyces sp. TRM65418]MCC3765276.1 GNAT family N-acetyltransferase [Glycomyces sp. TRM65418]QZD54897.1 GNAT family N-acetyltransferase [Glycomyces sp. TRM65418]